MESLSTQGIFLFTKELSSRGISSTMLNWIDNRRSTNSELSMKVQRTSQLRRENMISRSNRENSWVTKRLWVPNAASISCKTSFWHFFFFPLRLYFLGWGLLQREEALSKSPSSSWTSRVETSGFRKQATLKKNLIWLVWFWKSNHDFWNHVINSFSSS